MAQLIDRRLNGKNKSVVNRRRFLRRFRGQIQRAVADALGKRGVTEVDEGGRIRIPAKDVSEPVFHHGPGGRRGVVHTGNREFSSGDRIKRPPSGQGGSGSKGSPDGEGEDEFVFELTRDEFLEFFFEDLALPNLVKTKLAYIEEDASVRAGFSPSGAPSDLSIVRSLRGALGRRIAAKGPYLARIQEVEAEIARLEEEQATEGDLAALRDEVRELRRRIAAIPYIDTFDLKYHTRVTIPTPTTQAVMLCLMDVSGSMDQSKKDLAKRFFMLLYLFLTRTYEHTRVVFIRHHTVASEVEEQDFFYARETGGTVVSSALKLAHEIIQERFSTADWNIYVAQASDGENWEDDSPQCEEVLAGSLMPLVQYYAYVEISSEEDQLLWQHYDRVRQAWPNFAMQRIRGPEEIYPVFRDLFKRQPA